MNEREKNTSQTLESFAPSPATTHVGRYELIYQIGQGGMATVYAARLSKMAGFEKLVAVKIIHSHLRDDNEFISMFLDEARHAAGIRHPNVAEIFEVDEEDGLYYMVGELVVGCSLRDFMERAQSMSLPISQPIGAAIISQVAHGLNAAHKVKDNEGNPLGLVHRDVSPRNIIISYDGFVKLIDFGIAYASNRLAETQAGSLKGKLGFMPPEHIRGLTLDGRSDIFSLGVVLYLMITGVHPFPAMTEAARMQRILNGNISAPSKIVPGIDKRLDEIVLTALAPRASDRFETAGHMAIELERFARSKTESYGPSELSVLMHLMFPEEIAKHEHQLREFRKKPPQNPDESFSAVQEALKIQERSRVPSRTPIESTDTPLPIPEAKSHKLSLNWPFQAMAIGVAIIAAIAILMSNYPSPKIKIPVDTKDSILNISPLKKKVLNHETDSDASTSTVIKSVSERLPTVETPTGEDTATVDTSPNKRDDEIEELKSLKITIEHPKTSISTPTNSQPAKSEATIKLTIAFKPFWSSVKIDGHPYPPKRKGASFRLPKDGQKHLVEVSSPGYVTFSKVFAASKNHKIKIRLRKTPSRKKGKR